MQSPNEINPKELPLIEQIFNNECWYKGERVHHAVDRDDPEIRDKVVEIILTIGASMRQSFELSCTK